MTDEAALAIRRVAERLGAVLCQPLIESYLEQIAALEHELDLALNCIDQLSIREEEHAEF